MEIVAALIGLAGGLYFFLGLIGFIFPKLLPPKVPRSRLVGAPLAIVVGVTLMFVGGIGVDTIQSQKLANMTPEARAAYELEVEEKARAAEELARKAADAAARAEAEATAKAEAEAARQAQADEERERKQIQKIVDMAQAIVSTLKTVYDVDATSIYSMPHAKEQGAPSDFCRKDGFCELEVGPFLIHVWPLGNVEVLTSTQGSLTAYRNLCIGAFSAVSYTSIPFAADYINSAFANASRSGHFKADVDGVTVKIEPETSGILTCQYFRLAPFIYNPA